MTGRRIPAGPTIWRATFALAAITMGVKLLGFIEKQLIAYYFGVDWRVDAVFVAFSIPLALFVVVRELVEPAYLPLFVRHLDRGRASRAWGLFAFVLVGVLVFTVLAAVLVAWNAGAVVKWAAPGFGPEARALTVTLVRIAIGGSVFLGLSSLTYITLNGYRRFALAGAGDLVHKAAPAACLVLLASQLDVLALAVGFVVGSAGRLLLHLGGLRAQLRLVRLPGAESRDDLNRLALLMGPLLLGVAFSQLSELADNYFSSQVGSGAVAARTYARKIAELPILVLPYALSIVVFPHFASLAAKRDDTRLYAFLGRCVVGVALVFAPLSVLAVTLADPLVTLLLERGAFGAEATAATVIPLRMYAIGLVTFAVEAIVVPFYFALGDTRTPVLAGILGVAIDVTLASLLVGPMGVGGVALALTLSKTIKLALLGVLLRRKRPQISLGLAGATLGRLLVASAAAAAMSYALSDAFAAPGAGASLAIQVAYLTSLSIAAGLAFLGVVLSFDSPERALVRQGASWVADGISRARDRRQT